MFSFVGDTALDSFMGTGTVSLAAGKWGRNSVGVEIDPGYLEMVVQRLQGYGFGQMRPITIDTS